MPTPAPNTPSPAARPPPGDTSTGRVKSREWLVGLKHGVLLGLALAALALPPYGPAATPLDDLSLSEEGRPATSALRRADFAGEPASADAQRIADWVVASGDNGLLPFAIVDKRNAWLFVFSASGRLSGATPVLLGSARGDDSVAGIGSRPIADVAPNERTTPAGRFVSEPGRNATGEDVVWVDYDAAVSMHRVRASEPRERRLERLASTTADDNRISYGCINVLPEFYDQVVRPALGTGRGVIYVLPEDKPPEQVFIAAYNGPAR